MVRYTRFPAHSPQVPLEPVPAQGASTQAVPSVQRSAARTARAPGAVEQGNRSGVLLWLFLVSLVIPLYFHAGGLLLTPSRIVLLLALPVAMVAWASGKLGKPTRTDWLIIGFVFWMAVTLLYNHGSLRIELIGSNIVEMLGAYMIGRYLVRGPDDMDQVARFMAFFMVLMIAPTVMESVFRTPVIVHFFEGIGNAYNWVSAEPQYGRRLGLWRAQGPFGHPILFGIFCASAIPIFYYTRSWITGSPTGGFIATIPAVVLAFFSLSSGAFLSVTIAFGLILWDMTFRTVNRHWIILLYCVAALYVLVDIVSTRTPIHVFIQYAAFSVHNGYMRINQFTFGMQNVWANPIFGIGMGGWDRPRWMPASIDNFWLLMAMRYGIPGFLFLSIAWIGTIVSLSRLTLPDARIRQQRKGLLIALTATGVAMFTVHIWAELFLWVLFLLGIGGWMVSHAAQGSGADTGPGTDAADRPSAQRAGKVQPRAATGARVSPPHRTAKVGPGRAAASPRRAGHPAPPLA